MSNTLVNTIANFAGLLGSTGLTLVFSILYFHILGSENFGLISFCTTVLLVGNLFVDQGLGRTIIRELARREHNPELGQEMRDALFTLQSIHFGLALTCGVIIAVSSSWLAANWLNRETVPITEAKHAIILLGVVASLQLPREICRSALSGLQRQVHSNVLASAFSGLRGAATIVALFLIAPTPIVFLMTQAVVSILETATLFISVWIKMPPKERRIRFDIHILRDIWVFAVGDGLAILLLGGMTFGDRVLLSRLLPLDVFGSYSLAVMIAEVVLRIILPFSSAYFPHFADLIARNERSLLSKDYGYVSVVASAFLVPAAFILIAFANPILLLLTKHPAIAAAFAPLLAIRSLGNVTIALQYLPHTLQLAAGFSTPSLYVNALTLVIYLPGILYFTPIYGYLVPAILWLVVVGIQTPTMIFVTHLVALKGEAWTWVVESILRPALLSGVIVGASVYLAPKAASWFITLPWLSTTYIIAMISVLLTSKRTRTTLLIRWHLLIGRAFPSNKIAG